ncbi:NAD(P)/FAD-dependent oxidoreductase [Halobacillus naozhouensis]|uniref:NAD(P)/FAD-dependent oxidoreductase n=1 Tax=Halobacillus naozhouensis TaxID=554880 RepID=A0ABY8IXK5_9BACI|nr:NAD(P)/FAD-dependent oxidoreductase [Halobacillus naozhouensis]WFT74557.1 NAD(P)/FAD-dependent oxidoreductase [Halobacillus naozhouensis]
MEQRVDIVIVGARVAGASLAILLGQMGKRVLLIDKASFPSDTLSTHHLSHVHYLEKLGVREEVESTGLRKINRMRTYVGDSFVEGPRDFYTIIPKRSHLDDVLLTKACSNEGVELLESCTVKDLITDEQRVIGVEAVDKTGETKRIHASLVVGADGRHSFIAENVQAGKYGFHSPQRPVFYGYYHGIEPLTEPTTEIFLNEGRIGFLFPMEPGIDCLGLEVHSEEFKEMVKNSHKFKEIYQSFYGMEKRLQRASLQGKIVGTPGVPNFFREPAGEGWALIGDAAHSKDPSTGLGINDAFMQSFLLAEAIQKHDEGRSWDHVMAEFKQKRDEQLEPGYRLTLDYIQSMRPWSRDEKALFQAMAANPMVWNKIVPHLPDLLKEHSSSLPELYGSVEWEAKNFGFGRNENTFIE